MVIQFILEAISSTFIAALSIVTKIITFGQNDRLTLPDAVLNAMTTFKETVNTLIFYMPWMEVVWNVIILSLWIKVIIWVVEAVLFRRKLGGH